MFDHFVVSVVVIPPLVVLAAFLVAGRLAPALAARVLAWSAVVVAVASTANLALFALHAVAEVPTVAHLMGWSSRIVAADTAQVPWVSWGSVPLLAAVAVAVGWTHRRHRRDLRAGRLFARADGDVVDVGWTRRRHRRDLPARADVVVVDDAAVTAFAVPGRGRPGWVVVTTGMRGALTGGQYTALLAHERAHLAGAHHRLVRLAELAGAAHPALRWVSARVGFLVERAADEQAAAEVGDRGLVARAVGEAALAAAGRPGLAQGVLHAVAGAVPLRVAALLRPVRRTHPLLAFVPIVLAAGTVVWTGEAVEDLRELLELAARWLG
ncbi:M48 family metalloprotease [Herbidospora mongoliensis]|uniref:M48 family metalloprotease n=1 Tax=Herbidospora mongoliensis TaxID=688067 RepID=UPI0008310426|nr:M48 family metalloprotease [Herbidospora mongoliensis]